MRISREKKKREKKPTISSMKREDIRRHPSPRHFLDDSTPVQGVGKADGNRKWRSGRKENYAMAGEGEGWGGGDIRIEVKANEQPRKERVWSRIFRSSSWSEADLLSGYKWPFSTSATDPPRK